MNALARPQLVIIDGKITTTSNQIAAHFNKRHERVLDKIRNLDCSPEFTEHNFVLSEFTDTTGRKLPCYTLTRDGFVFLAMGFTGKEAAMWKETYIEAFNAMEAELLGILPAQPALDAAPRWTMEEIHELCDKKGYVIVEKQAEPPKTPSLMNRRWLISFDHLKREIVQQIPEDACLLTWKEIPGVIREPGALIESALLLDIMGACVERLEKRNPFCSTKGATA